MARLAWPFEKDCEVRHILPSSLSDAYQAIPNPSLPTPPPPAWAAEEAEAKVMMAMRRFVVRWRARAHVRNAARLRQEELLHRETQVRAAVKE